MEAIDRPINWEDLEVTREELEDLTNCLKQEEFRKLLIEYAEEVTNPDNRKLYEKEISQLERERGIDVTFINPEPGYVIKSSVDGVQKCFINISRSDKVARPSSRPSFENGHRGLQWSIPYTLAPPRDDVDKKKEYCKVFDVVFHPDTIYLAEKNSRFKEVLEETAFDGVEQNFKVKIDRNNLKYPKLSFKGISQSTVIRKKLENPPEKGLDIEPEVYQKLMSSYDESREKYTQKYAENTKETSRSPPQTTYLKSKGCPNLPTKLPTYTTPQFLVKHQTDLDLQDFQNSRDSRLNATVPKNLVIVIELPLLPSGDDAVLDVQENLLTLKSEKPAKYYLEILLSHRVNPDKGNAKFDSKKRKLTVTLPVIRSFPKICDDSGVESDQSPPIEKETLVKNVQSLITEVSSFSKEEVNCSERQSQFSDEKMGSYDERGVHFSHENSSFFIERSLAKVEKNRKNFKHKDEQKKEGNFEKNGKIECLETLEKFKNSETNCEKNVEENFTAKNTDNSKSTNNKIENYENSQKIDENSIEMASILKNSQELKIYQDSQNSLDLGEEFQNCEKFHETESNSSEKLIEIAKNSEGISKTAEKIGKNCTDFIAHHLQKQNSFLNSSIKYSLPQYTLNIYDNNLAIVLHVKNVDASSISQKFLENLSGIHITFSSIGAGFFPMFYSFCMRIADDVFDDKAISIEPWDNNVIVTVVLHDLSTLKSFKVGLDEEFMEEKDLPHVVSLEKMIESLKVDEINENLTLNDRKIEVIAENDEVVVKISDNHVDSDDENAKLDILKKPVKKPNFSKSRSISESSGDELPSSNGCRHRGILKYRRNTFSRSVSESSIDDTVGLVSSADFNYDSVQELNSESESCSLKKTVRFNDVVCKQLFRSNSSILGRRNKNQRKLRKKKQAYERRMSESENSETEERDKYKLEPKQSPVDTANTENVKPILNRHKHHSKSKNRRNVKESDTGAKFKNDLIFDLDM